MGHIDYNLPLSNPILIFSLVLFIILFAPLVLNRLKVPPIIGLIIAGAIIGPKGFYLMERGDSIKLFGTVGLLYIMFLAGLEIDMADFKKNKYKSLLFGMLTFLIPMGLGTAAGLYILELSVYSSILLASMFASHTLLAYPIASRFGISKNKAVNITVGGTVITDTLALLVLAVIVGMVKGDVNTEFWITLGISISIFTLIVLFLIPFLSRWFFKKEQDPISQYIFVLGIVFLSAFLAELAGIEGIIGAFLAGLALNKLIPHTSALMNRIDFVGNALFIPFFLIGVGMLIDFSIFVSGKGALLVAGVMTTTATTSKLLAAFFTKLSLKFTRSEMFLMFGLSNAQAAATLAAVLVGYNIILETDTEGNVVRLLNEDILNGTIIMILITCTISSVVVSRASKNIALLENDGDEEDEKNTEEKLIQNRFLIPVSDMDIIEPVINFSSLLKPKKGLTETYAIHIKTEDESSKKGQRLIEKALKAGASLDYDIRPISRHDINIPSGILNCIRENNITDVFLSLGEKNNFIDSFFGSVTDTVIEKTDNSVYIYRSVQPLNTIKNLIVVVPEQAEFEIGFVKWVQKIHLLSKELNTPILFYSNPITTEKIKNTFVALEHNLSVGYKLLDDWDDFLIIARDLSPDDLFIIVSARKNTLSYNRLFDKLPKQLTKYFSNNNLVIIFPEQYNAGEVERKRMDGSMDELLEENLKRLDNVGKYFKKLIKGK
ncbi:MAG: cation:proton antiporter [Flavobacteriales bacterium]